MNKHLSSEDLEQALTGDATTNATAHLQTCEYCSAELAEMRKMLGAMREQATSAAAFYLHQPLQKRYAPKRVRAPQWAMAMAAAVLVIGGVLSPRVLHRQAAPHVAGAMPVVSADSPADDALLSNVQSDLSASVPDPLLPLAATSTTAQQPTLSR